MKIAARLLLLIALATTLHAAPAPVGDRFAYPADASTDLPVLANDVGTGLTITAVHGLGFSIAPSGLALRFDPTPAALNSNRGYSAASYTVSGDGGSAVAAVVLTHPPLGTTPPPAPPLPVSYYAKARTIDPVNNFYDQNTVWFDHSRQFQRIDITFRNPLETPARTIIILKPGQNVSYSTTPVPGGYSPLVTGAYSTPLSRALIPASAAFAGYTTEPGAPRPFERWIIGRSDGTDLVIGYRATLPGTATPVFHLRDQQSFAGATLLTATQYTHFTAFAGPYPDARVFNQALLLPIIP